MKSIRVWSNEVHRLAVQKGWWDQAESGDGMLPSERNVPELLCLIHSEVSEALECYRKGEMMFTVAENGKPEGFWVEIADVVIRILDLAGAYQVDLEHILEVKHEYNKTRGYRHGNKLA